MASGSKLPQNRSWRYNYSFDSSATLSSQFLQAHWVDAKIFCASHSTVSRDVLRDGGTCGSQYWLAIKYWYSRQRAPPLNKQISEYHILVVCSFTYILGDKPKYELLKDWRGFQFIDLFCIKWNNSVFEWNRWEDGSEVGTGFCTVSLSHVLDHSENIPGFVYLYGSFGEPHINSLSQKIVTLTETAPVKPPSGTITKSVLPPLSFLCLNCRLVTD